MATSHNGTALETATTMDQLHISLDSTALDSGMGKRKLGSIEPDGTLIYDEG